MCLIQWHLLCLLGALFWRLADQISRSLQHKTRRNNRGGLLGTRPHQLIDKRFAWLEMFLWENFVSGRYFLNISLWMSGISRNSIIKDLTMASSYILGYTTRA